MQSLNSEELMRCGVLGLASEHLVVRMFLFAWSSPGNIDADAKICQIWQSSPLFYKGIMAIVTLVVMTFI